MDFRVNNPGSVQYGNFINYYKFNSAEERIALMPPDLWVKDSSSEDVYIVLDIGCNCGDFTQLLYKFLERHVQSNIVILGIDIDPVLITRAKEANKFPSNVVYETVNIMESTDVIEHFLQQHRKARFDAVFCLSITMWIHLNNGDAGLRAFLNLASKYSELLVVEPQPWKCYLTAVKRLKKANEVFNEFSQLKWRNNVENEIENYLSVNLRRRKVYESPPTKWHRKVCFFKL